MIEEGSAAQGGETTAIKFDKLITGVSPAVAQKGHDNATRKEQKLRTPRRQRQKTSLEVRSTNQTAWRAALFLAGCTDMSSKEQVGRAARLIAIQMAPDGAIHPVVCNSHEQRMHMQAIYDAT